MLCYKTVVKVYNTMASYCRNVIKNTSLESTCKDRRRSNSTNSNNTLNYTLGDIHSGTNDINRQKSVVARRGRMTCRCVVGG